MTQRERRRLDTIAPAAPTSTEVIVERWRDNVVERVVDRVAEEAPIALTYHGISHVVMLATPNDLEDLAAGFTLTEGIVSHPSEIRSLEARTLEDGTHEVRIGIPAERFADLLRRQRNISGRTGCGLCGAATIEDAIRTPPPVTSDLSLTAAELHAALREIGEHQHINRLTGSVHAAAWVVPGEGIRLVREDVGRHNALDKVIGALIRAGEQFSRGWLLITSRASYEMVQKAATVGVPLIAAVSAPTAFAVRLAERSGLTLVGFAREHQHVVYTHPSRLKS
jgi:FdhD protein